MCYCVVSRFKGWLAALSQALSQSCKHSWRQWQSKARWHSKARLSNGFEVEVRGSLNWLFHPWAGWDGGPTQNLGCSRGGRPFLWRPQGSSQTCATAQHLCTAIGQILWMVVFVFMRALGSRSASNGSRAKFYIKASCRELQLLSRPASYWRVLT